MLDGFEEHLAEVDWWIPWLREFDGALLLLWIVLVTTTVALGLRDMYRLRSMKIRGVIGPQEYRWRSDERGRYTGRLALNGYVFVPMCLVLLTLLGLFGVAAATSDNTAWNLLMIETLVFWCVAYRWLWQRLDEGFREPEPPDFGDDRPGEPLILSVAKHARSNR